MEPDDSDEGQRRLTVALAGVARGDGSSLTSLYRLTSAKLFGICLRICRDRVAAEDVLNEVYLNVWRRADTFDMGRGKPMTWLSTLARNRAIDWIRRHGRKMESDEVLATLPSTDPDPEMLAGQAEERRRLHDCIEGLADEQRDAIRSAFFDALTYAELATRKNVPLGTMKSWIRRGLIKLKDCLDGV